MMAFLGINDLCKLSPMIREGTKDRPVSPSWVQVYRELVEWAILFSIMNYRNFATDTLIVCDGLLRSKVFSGDLFNRLITGFRDAIERHKRESRRNIYLVGVAKHSKVLIRYRLAMALEGVLNTSWPAYIMVPREIEQKAYVWSEYARDDREMDTSEINKFVGGKMFLVKFGNGKRDPIWPVDIFTPQEPDAQTILGSLLNDAINGFPVPLYPQCLQKAHENAALVDFDFDILQDQIFNGIRDLLGEADSQLLDIFRIQDADPSQKRYS
jgi:hypothetical protein